MSKGLLIHNPKAGNEEDGLLPELIAAIDRVSLVKGFPKLPLLLATSLGALVVFCGSLHSSDIEMQTVLNKLVQKSNGHGGGIARIAGPGGVIWQGVSGNVAGPNSAPIQPDTPFEIASITKAFTATIIMLLAEDGRLSLDDNLSKVLPQRAASFKVDPTIRQLLSHTSGLPHYWADGPKDREGNNAFLRAFLANPDRFWSPHDILTYAQEIPARKPGKAFHYSDTNFVLLGVLIEKVTGKPLADAYREIIFNPLGMKSTWLSYREPRAGIPPSHRFDKNEDLHNIRRQSADWAGGGLISTASDLERFLRGLASGKLFKNPKTPDLMLDTVRTGDADVSYGLGLYVIQLDKNLGKLWGHDGNGNSFAYFWPEKGITFTGTLNQVDNDWWPLVANFLDVRR